MRYRDLLDKIEDRYGRRARKKAGYLLAKGHKPEEIKIERIH